ncbi:cupin domain-containing protein [Croceicoccus marinus]|uniref:Cupin n=1 Tax=Croceicoccus marinus TaxID=450378 RepID=A0A1Z1F9A2_9SPHN|nr:cupin domain-containing protein [Croceicoccus marinus]ARU15398.1 cupin [Croceicoccus marinus]
MTTRDFRQFDTASFLRGHWQQAPLLIRNPWQGWVNPLAPDELAGLACEEDVESRLVRRTASGQWDLTNGPLSNAHFAETDGYPWTLLVQAVDHHIPAVAALLEAFRFIPNWRIDDVMVSYASDGGGVGPHYDQYDVFLVQGLGRRRWRVGQRCDERTALLPHEDLRLLADFHPVHDWVLEPGDILYLPPGFAHDGVAVGDDCMTYSIGFRAPSRAELVSGWADYVIDLLDDNDRYRDPGLNPAANPGEITPEAFDRLHHMVTEALANRESFARWVGSLVSAPKSDMIDWSPEEMVLPQAVRADLAAGGVLERNPASRFAFHRSGPETLTLFVDGTAYDCDGATALFAETLCRHASHAAEPEWGVADQTVQLICDLANKGSVAIVSDD